MASSKPVIRTYVRKRKETAEEKYDAIFGTKSGHLNVISPIKNQNSDLKRRKLQTDSKHNSSTNSKLSSQSTNKEYGGNKKETAAEKFDAIFGTERKSNGDFNKTSQKKFAIISTNSDSDDEKESAELMRTHPILNTDELSDKEGKNQSKYELMFEQNEKRASDKFDAIFSESEHVAMPKPKFGPRKTWRTEGQSQVLDNLHSFNSWEDETISTTSSNSSRDTSPQKNITSSKLPNITHASMVKVGGRLVLNIQRGGISNSLVDKGGTVLLSSADKSVPNSPDNSPTKLHPLSPLKSPKKTVRFDAFSSERIQEVAKDVHTTLQAQASSKGFKSEVVVANSHTLNQMKILRDKLPKNKISNSPTKKLFSSSGKKISKSKVSYNPRPWASSTKDSQSSLESFSSESLPSSQPSQSSNSGRNYVSKTDEVPALKKSVTWPQNVGESMVTSIKCHKSHQQYFTVVKHVKNYQNCLEEGEIQEFEDEVLYLQEGLPSHQPISVRCLSVTSLACKCEQQNFRLYLRAHNVLTKVFDSLQDADENKALSLATSSLLYMLSRDRQIEINKGTLRILLKLVDPLENNNKDESKNKDKVSPVKTKYSRIHKKVKEAAVNPDQEVEVVRNKVKDMIDRCGDPLVTSKHLSTKVLASEALLRYTARRTSEWFREEIRLKGGLDHVIGLVKAQVDIVDSLPCELDCTSKPLVIERPLCMLERLLRVLENGIVNSARNAMYLVTHQRAMLLKKITLLMKKCENWLRQTEDVHAPDTPPSSAKNNASLLIKNVISQIIKLLVNISNDSEWSSTRIGDQEGMLHSISSCILNIPEHVNEEHRYEIMLLSLGLLVNLVESSAKNRMALMQMKSSAVIKPGDEKSKVETIPVVSNLVKLFIDREVAAKQNEILGEEGVKRAAEAKRKQKSGPGESSKLSHPVAFGDASDEGYWVESDEGMEWVSVEKKNRDDDELPSSQGSHRSIGDPENIEARLTAEEKDEMRQALEKANDHMEASIIASYTALVLGCLIHGSRANATAIRSQLPDNGELTPMIKMLKKFLSFMNLTHGMSKKGEQKLIQVIEDMEEVNLEKLP